MKDLFYSVMVGLIIGAAVFGIPPVANQCEDDAETITAFYDCKADANCMITSEEMRAFNKARERMKDCQ